MSFITALIYKCWLNRTMSCYYDIIKLQEKGDLLLVADFFSWIIYCKIIWLLHDDNASLSTSIVAYFNFVRFKLRSSIPTNIGYELYFSWSLIAWLCFSLSFFLLTKNIDIFFKLETSWFFYWLSAFAPFQMHPRNFHSIWWDFFCLTNLVNAHKSWYSFSKNQDYWKNNEKLSWRCMSAPASVMLVLKSRRRKSVSILNLTKWESDEVIISTLKIHLRNLLRQWLPIRLYQIAIKFT